MQTNEVKLYSLRYDEVATYLTTAAFVAGNILLPQLCHLIPRGGLIFLPIYLFTLIAAYKYGWRVGLLTAVLSPVVNHLLFGMPPMAVLPSILVKSMLLALIAGVVQSRVKSCKIWCFALIVAGYQGLGFIAEWAMLGDLHAATQDVRLGLIGMLLQVVVGYLFVKYILRR